MKKMYKLGSNILYITIIFWLGYTIIYQFIDGWHYAPISEFEAGLDKIVNYAFRIGFLLWMGPMVNVLSKLTKDHYDTTD